MPRSDMTFFLLCLCLGGVSFLGCKADSASGDCESGKSGCPCADGDQCLPGLQCLEAGGNKICVETSQTGDINDDLETSQTNDSSDDSDTSSDDAGEDSDVVDDSGSSDSQSVDDNDVPAADVLDCGTLTLCLGSCVDTDMSAEHCGTCETPCQGSQDLHTTATCSGGQCQPGCEEGFLDCNGDDVDGCESRFSCDPIVRISMSSTGSQLDARSSSPDISSDGQFVVFETYSGAFSSSSTERVVIIHDRESGEYEEVSVDASGEPAAGATGGASVSSNGQFVSFWTESGLDPGDANSVSDVYLRDRQSNSTVLISVGAAGTSEPHGGSSLAALSASGRHVVFSSTEDLGFPTLATAANNAFLRNLQTGELVLLSRAFDATAADSNSTIARGGVSDDGARVAFTSRAANLVAGGGDSAETWDVFVRDVTTSSTVRASLSTSGVGGNDYSVAAVISGDGRFVAFESTATNLVAGDTNGVKDVFVHDLQARLTTRISVSPTGAESTEGAEDLDISGDGRFVVFASQGTEFIDGGSITSTFNKIYVHDRQDGSMHLVSRGHDGSEADGHSRSPAISSDGKHIAFHSDATNLVPNDTNSVRDVFVARNPAL